MDPRITVLIAKPGLDGHTRGALVVAQALRDAGMNVVYSGIRKTPEQIVQLAIRKQVDIIGLSCLSGAHLEHFPEVVRLLREKQLPIPVIGGGVIPHEHIPHLLAAGISAIFTSGTPLQTIVSYIRDTVTVHGGQSYNCFSTSPG
ncbi:cobalamin B12-binding domain-containing protein [Paenibacillus hamazuiensis]|uniref:cobalamin B12-binding domain-containing protein n=1 Tax=Paenibacillus hamazuiensis TaxID=2936508 RepID=UPI0030841346